jgi:hypothetical protein
MVANNMDSKRNKKEKEPSVIRLFFAWATFKGTCSPVSYEVVPRVYHNFLLNTTNKSVLSTNFKIPGIFILNDVVIP